MSREEFERWIDPLANVERLLERVLESYEWDVGRRNKEAREAVRLLLDVGREQSGRNQIHHTYAVRALLAFARSLGGDPR